MANNPEQPQLSGRMRFAAFLIAALFVTGVVVYKMLGGPDASWLDAVYMTANVLTTAGFREAVDVSHNPTLMMFTVALLVFGAGTVVYAISIFTAFVIEGDLTQNFRRRRMKRMIGEMNGHFIVCGAGATGMAVIRELVKTERPVAVIEVEPARVQKLEADLPNVPILQADFTDDQVLMQAGVARAMGIVISTTIDKDSLVTTMTARHLNPKIRIIARAANDHSMSRLRQAGADGVVSPAMIGGMRMASELVRPNVVSFLDTMLRDTDRNLRIEEVAVPADSPIIGRTLGEVNLHAQADCVLLAMKKPDGGYRYNPPDLQRVVEGLVLIVMGDPNSMRALRTFCATGVATSRPSLETPVRSSVAIT